LFFCLSKWHKTISFLGHTPPFRKDGGVFSSGTVVKQIQLLGSFEYQKLACDAGAAVANFREWIMAFSIDGKAGVFGC
jgi:hypothetical protein